MELNKQEKELINARLFWFSQVVSLINEYTNLADWRLSSPLDDIQLSINLLNYYDDEEYKMAGYPPEVMSSFELLRSYLKENIYEDTMLCGSLFQHSSKISRTKCFNI